VLPFLPAWNNDAPTKTAALDIAADAVLEDDTPPDELCAARVRLAEHRMREALIALEEAGLHEASAQVVARLEQLYAREVAAHEHLLAHRAVQPWTPE
jgi:hypothetical protein